MMNRINALALGVGLVLAGCAGPLSKGVSAYRGGCYPEAARSLASAEPDLAGMSPRERARYALYRGLTHMALGDDASAHRWLIESKAIYDASHYVLDAEDEGRLLAAWQSLGYENGEWGALVARERGLR